MKTLGIIGGMGPEAALDLAQMILDKTGATKDQDHIPVLLYNNTAIPDRSECILHGGENPAREIIRTAKILEAAGADVLMMSCNTAHYFYDEIRKEIHTPFLHMIDLTAKRAEKDAGPFRLLATEGTYQSGLYEHYFKAHHLDLRIPNAMERKAIMAWIYRIKGGDVKAVSREMEPYLKKHRDEVLILGCTELPLVLPYLSVEVKTLNPTEILAKAAVDFALGQD